MTALSKQSPIEPMDGTSPESWARRVNAHEVNCTP
jgi:Txe/YoeB family toxin of Txe-Axe toxin-antitoxin module